jgi:signal transduction histidine kinase
MRTLRTSIVLGAAALAVAVSAASLSELSLSDLETRLKEIDSQLEHLANYGLGSGIGPIGYRSAAFSSNNVPEWIKIDFQQEFSLDEIMLVPAIRRDAREGFKADGFPEQFRLIAGSASEPNGIVVAEYSNEADILPRIAPLVIPCNGIRASWIRVEAQQLGQRGFDKAYVVQFSEIVAFSGEENVALRKEVTSSLGTHPRYSAWGKSFVVDGIVPYLMDVANGEQSNAYLTPAELTEPPALTIDLEESYPISRIHLHAVEGSDTLPQAFAGDYGIPKQLRVEGANQADFSDATTLLELHYDTIYDMGPIMMYRFPATPCRYVRFSVAEPAVYPLYGEIEPRLGFSEIEIFSKGRNVARTKKSTTSFNIPNPFRTLKNLTDGRNIYGRILPIREWLNQLSLRHHLEKERPHIAAELSHRYARQKIHLHRMSWLAALLALGIGITILIDRKLKRREIAKMRERFSADLHDELGANLHSISLLVSLAKKIIARRNANEEWAKLIDAIDGVSLITEETREASRYFTNLLETRSMHDQLVNVLQRITDRMLTDMDHTMSITNEDLLQELKPQKRLDLTLFYKESLTNIVRHSGATRADTRITADNKYIYLTICDNGTGITSEVPKSLKRRARLLGATVAIEQVKAEGTRIALTLPIYQKTFGDLLRWGVNRRSINRKLDTN